MTVNDNKMRGCSVTPHPPISEEGRPERVPAAGNGNGTSLNNSGSNGNYWSSVPNSDNNNAYELNFNSGNHNTNNNNINAYKGVEFLGAYVKPYRTYPSMRSLRRMRGRMRTLDWHESPDRIQARANSMLGVLSHYDCWHVRKELTWEARLREFGKVTDDCLRFYPDMLKFGAGVRPLN